MVSGPFNSNGPFVITCKKVTSYSFENVHCGYSFNEILRKAANCGRICTGVFHCSVCRSLPVISLNVICAVMHMAAKGPFLS